MNGTAEEEAPRLAVRVVARRPVAAGFALAGVPVAAAESGAEAAARIEAFRGEGGIGVILLEDVLHEALPAGARQEAERTPLPAVIPFPGPAWTARPPAEEYVVELLRRAIGYRVRLG